MTTDNDKSGKWNAVADGLPEQWASVIVWSRLRGDKKECWYEAYLAAGGVFVSVRTGCEIREVRFWMRGPSKPETE